MPLQLSEELVNKIINLYLERAIAALKKKNKAFNIGSDYHQGLTKSSGFLEGISDLIEDRDITADDTQTPTRVASAEQTKTSYLWKTKLVEVGISEVKRFTGNQNQSDALSLYFGKMYAEAMVRQMYDLGIGAVVAAIQNEATLINGDGTTQLSYTELNKQLSLFGDSSQSIVDVVMRGLQYHTLIGDASTNKAVENVMGATIIGGETSLFGRSGLVYDSGSLQDGTDKNFVLGLVADAISLQESEKREFFFDVVGNRENIMYQYKFEGGFDVGLKGYTYSKTAGHSKADILASANWSKLNVGNKQTAGVLGHYAN